MEYIRRFGPNMRRSLLTVVENTLYSYAIDRDILQLSAMGKCLIRGRMLVDQLLSKIDANSKITTTSIYSRMALKIRSMLSIIDRACRAGWLSECHVFKIFLRICQEHPVSDHIVENWQMRAVVGRYCKYYPKGQHTLSLRRAMGNLCQMANMHPVIAVAYADKLATSYAEHYNSEFDSGHITANTRIQLLAEVKKYNSLVFLTAKRIRDINRPLRSVSDIINNVNKFEY